MKRIPEQDVICAFMTMMNKLAFAADAVLVTYTEAMQRDCERGNIDRIRELEAQSLKCLKERFRLRKLLEQGRGDAHSHSMRIMELEAEEAFVRETLRKLRLEAGSAELTKVSTFRQQVEAWRILQTESENAEGQAESGHAAGRSEGGAMPAIRTGTGAALPPTLMAVAEELLPEVVETITVYTGKQLIFTLRCGLEIMDQVIDRFREDVEVKDLEVKTVKGKRTGSFTVTVPVNLSTTFYAWVFTYVGQMKILGPEKVRKEYEGYLRQALKEMTGE